jgi:putative oxidoreductase
MNKDISVLFIRLSFGLTMIFSHGLPKLLNYSQMKGNFPDPLGIGNSASLVLTIFSELICPLLICIGLKTRMATIPIIITMLVAALIIHAGDPFTKIEFPLLYVYGFTALLISGPGKFSFDKK